MMVMMLMMMGMLMVLATRVAFGTLVAAVAIIPAKDKNAEGEGGQS